MQHTKSKAAFAKAQQIMPGGVSSPVRAFKAVGGEPFMVSRGEGAYLIDLDGNRYVDFINSWGPLVLGHAHPLVVAALQDQLQRGTSFGACCELEAELAEEIISLVPSIEMLRFVSSGTEAVMSALRLARGFTGRSKILKFSGCYHGHADSVLVDAGSGVATLGIPGSKGVLTSTAQDTLTVAYNDIESVQKIFDRFPNEIAAVILEPIVGNAGFIKPLPDFLAELRAITTKHAALLIFDEVMTGFRVDLRGAQGLYSITPDLTLLGKVIGGGLPVGAFGGRRDIMQNLAPLGPVYQAGTLSGNPLAMTAGLATLREWRRPGNFEKVAVLTKELVQTLTKTAADNSIPLCSDSQGAMFGFYFHPGPVTNYEEAKRSDTARFARFFNLMLERGVYFAPSQFEAGFISLVHQGAPMTQTIQALNEVMPLL